MISTNPATRSRRTPLLPIPQDLLQSLEAGCEIERMGEDHFPTGFEEEEFVRIGRMQVVHEKKPVDALVVGPVDMTLKYVLKGLVHGSWYDSQRSSLIMPIDAMPISTMQIFADIIKQNNRLIIIRGCDTTIVAPPPQPGLYQSLCFPYLNVAFRALPFDILVDPERIRAMIPKDRIWVDEIACTDISIDIGDGFRPIWTSQFHTRMPFLIIRCRKNGNLHYAAYSTLAEMFFKSATKGSDINPLLATYRRSVFASNLPVRTRDDEIVPETQELRDQALGVTRETDANCRRLLRMVGCGGDVSFIHSDHVTTHDHQYGSGADAADILAYVICDDLGGYRDRVSRRLRPERPSGMIITLSADTLTRIANPPDGFTLDLFAHELAHLLVHRDGPFLGPFESAVSHGFEWRITEAFIQMRIGAPGRLQNLMHYLDENHLDLDTASKIEEAIETIRNGNCPAPTGPDMLLDVLLRMMNPEEDAQFDRHLRRSFDPPIPKAKGSWLVRAGG